MIEVSSESAKFNTSRKLDNQGMMVLEKVCFSDFKIMEICGLVSREDYAEEKNPIWIERQNIENQDTELTTISLLG